MIWEQIFALIIGNSALIIPLLLWSKFESREKEKQKNKFIEINNKMIQEIRKGK